MIARRALSACLIGLLLTGCAGEPEAPEPGPSSESSSLRFPARPGDTFDYLLGATASDALTSGASVVAIDGEETTADDITALHDADVRVICYVNGGAWEPWRSDAADFPDDLKGEPVEGWPDERWLDIRQRDRLIALMEPRVADCAAKGFDAIEFDNVDGYLHETGFELTIGDQKEYLWALADLAHRHDLAAALKNNVELTPSMVSRFDLAINEQCMEFQECAPYSVFTKASRPVYNIEYRDSPDRCSEAEAHRMISIVKDLDLGPGRTDCP